MAAVGRLRLEPLSKPPGVAETVEWADAATQLNNLGNRWPDSFGAPLVLFLKDQDDISFLDNRLDEIIG